MAEGIAIMREIQLGIAQIFGEYNLSDGHPLQLRVVQLLAKRYVEDLLQFFLESGNTI